MLLRDMMWDVFLSTGDIEIYLLYRSSCLTEDDQESQQDCMTEQDPIQ